MATDRATIPPRVRERVASALAQLRRWNASLEQARAMEQVAQAPGRYEYEIRYTASGATARQQLAQAEATLATFETLAPANGVDPEMVYAALGGRPALLPEGAHVPAWRPSTQKGAI